MSRLSQFLALLALSTLSACATTAERAAAPRPAPILAVDPVVARPTVTLLISIDGFRADYLSRGVSPTLSALAANGVSAAMRPSFPSKTFPNHYTLVTGKRPDANGIVANKMEDVAKPKDVFTMASDDPFWWNGATPIWVDAEKAGVRSGTMFWPGSNVANGGTKASEWPYEISGGTRPQDWMQYNEAISDTQRVNGVLDWMRRPAAIRPRFVTMYFEEVDTAGHQHGPGSAEVNAAVAAVDASIKALIDGFAALGQPVNLVIVADHGMAATSSTRVIALDAVANPVDYRVVETGPYAALAAVPGHEKALETALLRPHEHMQCWRKAEIPERFHYGRNPRVPPYLCLAEIGWQTAEHPPKKAESGGAHGYDNEAPEMAALFIANGPAFRGGVRLESFDNVDVYPLLAKLIGVTPRPGDGDATVFAPALKP